MYETLKRLYDSGRLSEDGLQDAVRKGWITEKQIEIITREGETQ